MPTTSTPASSSTTSKGGRLRTETTINNTRDFEIGKRLTNLPALREIGFSANRRLLHVQRLGHDPITGTDALHTITDPLTTATGARVPGLRLADRRSHALLQALLMFRLPAQRIRQQGPARTHRRSARLDPGAITTGQTTYDLRRLKHRGLITRSPGHATATRSPTTASHRPVPDLRARPLPAHRTGPPHRPHPLPTTARSLPRLQRSSRNPHPHNRTRRQTPTTRPNTSNFTQNT